MSIQHIYSIRYKDLSKAVSSYAEITLNRMTWLHHDIYFNLYIIIYIIIIYI